jgi:hypothetical protein
MAHSNGGMAHSNGFDLVNVGDYLKYDSGMVRQRSCER